MNPVRRLKSIVTPPCSECAYSETEMFRQIPKCTSSRYLDYIERTECVRFRSADAVLVRGTRYCRFERKSGDDES